MEENWTKRTKNGPKKYAYELMKQLDYKVLDPEDIHPAVGGYKISYLCDSKQEAEQLCEEAREVANDLDTRVYTTSVRKFTHDTWGAGDWRSEYSFLYDSDNPEDIREWNNLMDEYQIPIDLDQNGEPETADYSGRSGSYGYHRDLGIKFLSREAISSPNFDMFMSKAAKRRYWANIIIEPYYPEE